MLRDLFILITLEIFYWLFLPGISDTQFFFLVSDIKFDIRNPNKTAPHTRSKTRINYVRDNNKFGDPILRLRE